MKLQIQNNLADLPSTQYSFLDARRGAGDGTIFIKNSNVFTAQHAIQLGKTGEAEAEITTVGTITSVSEFTIGSALLHDHSMETPVYDIHYNKIIVKRSTSGTAGTASAIGTVSITPNSPYTEYHDTSGAASYAYKTQYYNSINGDLSSESDWFVPGGPSFYSLQKLRDRVKGKLFSTGYIKSDDTVNDWINEWVEQMTNEAIHVNQAYPLGTAAYSFGTAGLGTITAPLFKHANKIEVTTDGVSYIPTHEISITQFDDTDTFTDNAPRHYWQGDTVFGVLPRGEAGTARFTLSQFFTPLTDDADELPQYLRPYTTGCIEYVLYTAYDSDEKHEIADKHYKKFMAQQDKFIRHITPRDTTGVKYIDLTEGLSGMNEDVEQDVFV